MGLLGKLKPIYQRSVAAACFWLLISIIASFFQAMEVRKGNAKCETDTYIEYVIFTDFFCEVKK